MQGINPFDQTAKGLLAHLFHFNELVLIKSHYFIKLKNLVGGSLIGYPLPTERLVPAR